MNQDAARETYVASIRSDADLMSAAARTGDLDAPIAACPGWDLRKLVEHTAFIHRWATAAITHAAPPGPDLGPIPTPTSDDNLAVWIVDGAAELIAAIERADPDGDTWHPFPFEQKNWVWARRQAMETAIHRWDAEMAVKGNSSLDATIASDGIHEYVEMMLPRVLGREKATPPSASLHIHCTDVDGEWLMWSEKGEYRMLPIHDKGDAAIRGEAESLWLVLMGRKAREEVDIVGDANAAHAWLDLPGL